MVRNRLIRISRADKGGATVIQNIPDYEAEALRQLNNPLHYEALTINPTRDIAEESNTLLDRLKDMKMIDENTYNWGLLTADSTRTSIFYHLPKIHKTLDHPPGRPIVSGCGGPTENLSKLIDHWLQPLVQLLPSYIKDSTDFLQTITEWNNKYAPLPAHALIVTIDVVGLYTNIPHDEVEVSVTEALNNQSNHGTPPLSMVLKIINHVLKNNVFSFGDLMFKQIHGTAMGTPMAPTIANLFMGWLERSIISNSPMDIAEWKRYIDDIITIWLHGEDKLTEFMEWLNSLHPTIKFTHSFGRTNVPFLDISLTIDENGQIKTDLFVKKTDAAMILPFYSCHPRHCVRSIPYSQCLRLRRLCSKDEDFHSRCLELKEKLTTRGYPSALIHSAIDKAYNIPRQVALEYVRKDKSLERVPYVIRHNPLNPPLNVWLKTYLPVMHTSRRMLKAVPLPPIIGERNCTSLGNMLMPSKIPKKPSPSPENPGCHPCKKCTLCKTHLKDTRKFHSVVTGESFTIRDDLSCSSSNVIYLMDCSRCNKVQYVGETGQTIKRRFYNHTYNIRHKIDTLVSKHFVEPEHSISDMTCTIIEQVKIDNTDYRKQREKFWRYKLKTNFPDGLNVFD